MDCEIDLNSYVWIKDLSVARHQAWRSAGKVVMLRIHEIIPDQHRHQDWPKGTLHASYAHVAHMGYGTLLERIGQRESNRKIE